AGIPSELYPEPGKLKKQFAYADKKTIPYTLIIGEEEVQKGQYQLRNMQSGAQELLVPAEIIGRLKG
ncbi:MAG: histidine--tRNA ligase, partial [Bacteroidetes bacterium]